MDIQKLKELAQAATPGPWDAGPMTAIMGAGLDAQARPNPEMVKSVLVSRFNGQIDADGAFIAAANPAAVLELIDRLETAGTMLAGAQERCSLLLDAKNEWADRARNAEAQRDELLAALKVSIAFIENFRVPQDTLQAAIQIKDGSRVLATGKSAIASCEVPS